MQISLRNPENGLWFLPGTSFHLSFENPGPIEVNTTLLTPEQKTQIRLSLLSGDIKADSVSELNSYKPVEVQNKMEPIKDILNEPQDINEVRENKIKTLLSKGVASIKKSLPELGITELRLVLSKENSGKKRKQILTETRLLLDKHQKEVAENLAKVDLAISSSSEEAFIKQGLTKINWTNIEDVVESNIETIEFQLGDND